MVKANIFIQFSDTMHFAIRDFKLHSVLALRHGIQDHVDIFCQIANVVRQGGRGTRFFFGVFVVYEAGLLLRCCLSVPRVE